MLFSPGLDYRPLMFVIIKYSDKFYQLNHQPYLVSLIIIGVIAVGIFIAPVCASLKGRYQGTDHFRHFHQLVSGIVLICIVEQPKIMENACKYETFPNRTF